MMRKYYSLLVRMKRIWKSVLNFLELNLITGINRFKIMTILSSSNYTSKTLF